jgi:hypothetical protein
MRGCIEGYFKVQISVGVDENIPRIPIIWAGARRLIVLEYPRTAGPIQGLSRGGGEEN